MDEDAFISWMEYEGEDLEQEIIDDRNERTQEEEANDY